MEYDGGIGLARQLALQVEERLGDEWWAKPQIAVMRPGPQGEGEIEMFEVNEPAASTLLELPRPRPGVVAVGLSALGHTTLSGSTAPYRVRVTIAATCCAVVAIVRSADSCDESRSVDGEIVADLRAWAQLKRCTCRAA